MGLEEIATLSAAAVALIGIPASILIGRWQMKAALRTAEATSEAGLAQAESAYRAALDAVRAEANAAHLQWRRGIQREAYASFLLSANGVTELGERFAVENADDLPMEGIRAGKASIDEALATLKAAQTIIELEGPDDVAAPAAVMTNAAQTMIYHFAKQAIYERAWGKLGRITDAEISGVSSPAADLLQALSTLSRCRSTASSGADEPNRQSATDARAAERACLNAWNALPYGALDEEEFSALVEGWRYHHPSLDSSYLDANQRFKEAETRFFRAAKIELHTQTSR
ncbi:hypothetical protein ACF07L_34485 [Streptomyces anulatus]|uniref:hypothetical protein n=1 Tax=Streptomyces anulatus TaxID=1892 RepID=UPI0036FBA610